MRTRSPEYTRILRSDFYSFVQRCFPELHGGQPLVSAKYLELIAATMERVRRGECRRLIINIPPRHLKSIIGSVAFPAWCLGQDPTKRIVCVSYGQDLAEKHARDCRTIMNAKFYRDLFGVTLKGQKASDLETTKGGMRFATSVGGSLTGRGGDIIIIDDPHKPDEILSETVRRGAIDWFRTTLLSRMNDKKTGAIVIIMQRLHEEDLTGHLLDEGGWEHLCLPAIADENECYSYETIFGREQFVRSECELLNPEREPMAVIYEIWRDMGDYDFDGQYQQRPAPLAGGMIKRGWFKTYREAELPACYETVQSWDTASKDGRLNDYSVCTTWAVVSGKAYLKHVHRERHQYPDLKRAVREQQRLHRANVVLVEDKGSGIQLVQDLIHEGAYGVVPRVPQLAKVVRMLSQTDMISNGFVYLPDHAPWIDAYLHELCMFPNGKHDDQVDSTSQFLEWLKLCQMYEAQQPIFGSYGMGGRK